MNYHGYAGMILHVDLSSGEVTKEPLDLGLAERFLGGFGVNNWLAYHLFKPRIDPLSADNLIILGAGPLVGTMTPGATRVMGTTKFPLTGAIASAAGGMSFGCQLKWAGYDHVVISGRAKAPVYLKIFDDDVELCDAKHLWGKGVSETTDGLWAQYGRCGVVSIGQAGENLVRFSLAFIDKPSSTLGRGGLGAVMGSKNLKAIVCRGTKGVNVADRKRYMKAVDGLYERVRRYPLHKLIVEQGVMQNWENYAGQLFTYRNWTAIPPADRLTELYGPSLYDKMKKKPLACPSCFICDKEIVELIEGEYKGLAHHSSSILNLAVVGSRFAIDDYTKAARLMWALDEYGICFMTFCGLVDFTIDLYERGMINKDDTQGLVLNYDFDTVLTLMEQITWRKGFGDVLADGWSGLIKKIGRGIEREAPIIKGIDYIFDPRVSGLGTMEFEGVICPKGPHSGWGGSPAYLPGQSFDRFRTHADRMGTPPEAIDRILASPLVFNAGRLCRYSEDWSSLFNSLGVCNRHVINRFYSADILAELYSATTGIELDRVELMKRAERVFNLWKMINVREGFSRKDDTFPEQWFRTIENSKGSELAVTDYSRTRTLSRSDFMALLDDYYEERGWNIDSGIPTKEKLNELGLSDIGEDASRLGLL